MQDHELISQQLEKFFNDQHRGAQERSSMGGPVSDIYSSLASIRQILPDYDNQTQLSEWIPLAQQVIADERQKFRHENEDEAGWGSATFVELSDLLYVLKSKK